VFGRIAFSIALLSLASCEWNSKSARIGERTVVEANGLKLSLKAFSDRYAKDLKFQDAIVVKSPLQLSRSRDLVIREFILEALVADYAAKNSLQISAQELEQNLNQTRGQYPDDLAFRRVLAEDGVSLAEWKIATERRLLQEKVFALFKAKVEKPEDADLRKYFDANKERFKRGERAYFRQIVVEDMNHAIEVKEALKKKDFAELARKYSIAPESKQGGVVGWIEKGMYDVFDKVFAQGLNVVSAPLESPFGVHLVRAEKRLPAGYRSYEESKTLIEQLFVGEKAQKFYTEWLDQQLRASKVSIDYDLIRSLKVETRLQEW
jgi:peptidyl-prolyl cis-trans isomerase C